MECVILGKQLGRRASPRLLLEIDVGERLGDGRERETLTARPISQELRPRRSTLDGNPIEHGNIQVFETGGQSRYRAMGLRHDDLRMHDHGGERFDHGVVTARLHRAAPSLRRIVCTKWHASPMVDEVLTTGERLSVGVADDEAPPIQLGVGLVDGPGRREAALRHGVNDEAAN